jgi:hypothetical protein
MVLTVSFVLLCDRAFLSPSSHGYGLSAPGRADFTSAGLDAGVEASGPHDFAVRNIVSRPLAVDRSQIFRSALRPRRAQNAAASTASLPAFRDDHDTPLGGVGWREFVEMICPTGKAKYFCKGGLPDGQISGLRAHSARVPVRRTPGDANGPREYAPDDALGYWPWSLLAQPEPLPDAAHKIGCPVLVMWSAQGPLGPLVRRRTGHAVARLGRRCQGIRARRRAFFPGSGTWADLFYRLRMTFQVPPMEPNA